MHTIYLLEIYITTISNLKEILNKKKGQIQKKKGLLLEFWLVLSVQSTTNIALQMLQ